MLGVGDDAGNNRKVGMTKQPLVRLPFLLALADRASDGIGSMKDIKSKIEQVVTTDHEAQAMKEDDSLVVIMSAPIPWSDQGDVLVIFWRKCSPPPWVKAA